MLNRTPTSVTLIVAFFFSHGKFVIDRSFFVDSFVSPTSCFFHERQHHQQQISFFQTNTQPTSCNLGRSVNIFASSSTGDDDKDESGNNVSFDTGEVGSGPNWIERSFPISASAKSLKSIEDYNIGVCGLSFGTGPLSKRMFDTIMSKTSIGVITPEIERAFTMYAMDFTAKEAVRAALEQNGLEMKLQESEQDEGMWGDVDSIQLLDETTNEPIGPMYESVEDAIDHWTPGQAFSFVARQVPAKLIEISVSDLLQILDQSKADDILKPADDEDGEDDDGAFQ